LEQFCYIMIDDARIPVKIIEERRNGARVSLGAKHVILRIPKTPFFKPDVDKHIEWASGWLQKLKVSKPNALERFLAAKQYSDGDIFSIGGQQFFLDIRENMRESGTIRLLKEGVLSIQMPNAMHYDRQKLIKSLLVKFCQKYFLPDMILKVNHFNHLHFQKSINSVRLKYNTSNWGSCSTGQNLNFSVRLFFAPEDVIDYVVIHELAHLVEMNHSPRFWKLVEDIMPDYESKELILKKNSALYDF
jgi:predicted metal-dependent hydrolase